MHTNPGKHTKGQDPSFHSHHTGPRGKEFISGDSARAKSLYKRKRTLFAKAEELHVSTGSDVFLEVRPKSSQPMHFKTDFYKDYKIQKNSSDDENNNSVNSLNLESTSSELDSSILDVGSSLNTSDCNTSTSTNSTAYISPTKRRVPLKSYIGNKKIKFLNKAVQTRELDVGVNENKPNTCRVCGIEHESEEDIGTDSRWIGCDFVSSSKGEQSECGYWVHEKCLGLYPVSGSTCEKKKGRGKSRIGKSDVSVNRLYYCPNSSWSWFLQTLNHLSSDGMPGGIHILVLRFLASRMKSPPSPLLGWPEQENDWF
ncbi:uncharacterized protein LOC143061981 [Mytilus galloprovincialis]|uniref:uncharacterized protein LOC143061981 n=1 Tax=Mytilus galloprovincialis TaxID=29158 RepID=UPI003F7C4AC0